MRRPERAAVRRRTRWRTKWIGFSRADDLARDILRLTRNTLLVNLRFLDLALSQFQLSSYPGTLATDGEHLFYDTYYVLSSYKSERGKNVRDYLHIVLHCVFRHLFAGGDLDRRCWDLACDIAVESAIDELHLEAAALQPGPGPGGGRSRSSAPRSGP